MFGQNGVEEEISFFFNYSVKLWERGESREGKDLVQLRIGGVSRNRVWGLKENKKLTHLTGTIA